VKNGTLGTVERIEGHAPGQGDRLAVRLDDGRSVGFDVKDYAHIDQLSGRIWNGMYESKRIDCRVLVNTTIVSVLEGAVLGATPESWSPDGTAERSLQISALILAGSRPRMALCAQRDQGAQPFLARQTRMPRTPRVPIHQQPRQLFHPFPDPPMEPLECSQPGIHRISNPPNHPVRPARPSIP